MAEIYLAGEFQLWKILLPALRGVEETTVGYANGQVESTNYQLDSPGRTMQRRSTGLRWRAGQPAGNPAHYFRSFDPLSLNKQEMM